MSLSVPMSQSNLYDLDYINKVIEVYDQEILESLDLKVGQDGSILMSCPIHDGDNPRAFSYCSRRRRWQCFTHHCHDQTNTTLVGLVQSIKKIGFREAIEYILGVTGQTGKMIDVITLDRKVFVKQKSPSIAPRQARIFDPSELAGMSHDNTYFFGRGLTEEILKTFGAFYCQDRGKTLYGRSCVTIKNGNGEIIGFTGRKTAIIDPDDSDGNIPKWKHAPKELSLGQNLFGLDIAKEYIKKTGVANLVEGPIDLMKMHQAGFLNTVCTLSNKFTAYHRKLLLENKCKTIVDLYDPDEGGETGSKRANHQTRLYFNYVSLRNLLRDDPGDMTSDELKELLTAPLEEICKKHK